MFRCRRHGEFDIFMPFSQDVPSSAPCKYCAYDSPHIIKPPGGIIVEGGTGAGRGYAPRYSELAWEEKANEQQHDPYTQAKYQTSNAYHRNKDLGLDTAKPTEDSVQATAVQIAKEKGTGAKGERRAIKRALKDLNAKNVRQDS